MKNVKSNGFRAYRTFASRWNILILYLLMPIAFVAVYLGNYWEHRYLFYFDVQMSHLFATTWYGIMVWLEIIMDWWVFGGICHKDGVGLDYLRSSVRGMEYVESALRVDAVCRFLRIAFCLLLCGILGGMVFGGGYDTSVFFYKMLVPCLLLVYIVSTAGIWVARHCNALQEMMLWGSLGFIVYVVLWVLMCIWGEGMFQVNWIFLAACALLTALAAAITVFQLKYVMRKVRLGYYDTMD